MDSSQLHQPPPLQTHDIDIDIGIGHGHGHDIGTGMSNGVDLNGALYVKVMTDEQLEILRTQIAVYTTLSQQLVQMHKSITSHQDFSGVGLGNLYCDPMVTAIGHKITARQRWTPTPVQLQILEDIFDKGTGTPSKQKIKEIAVELSQHGHISETNVYNWFQNRRARSKRKQLHNAQNNAETEIETDIESPKDKMTKPEFQSQNDSVTRAEDLCYENQEISSSMHSVDIQSGKMEPMFATDGSSRSSQSPSQLAFYESILQNPRVEHLNGKMEVPGSCYHFPPPEDYSMTG